MEHLGDKEIEHIRVARRTESRIAGGGEPSSRAREFMI